MGKKKREHVVFDQMRKQKKSIPFAKVNKEVQKPQKSKGMQSQNKLILLLSGMKIRESFSANIDVFFFFT